MINKIKNYIFSNKEKSIFYFIIFIFFVAIIVHSFSDLSVWWDEAVYIGMGKYIASSGDLGMWEMFRPPFFPLVYAFLFKLGIPLFISGKIIVAIFSAGVIFLSYLISESIKKGSGIITSIFLFLVPVFFYFSKVAITDITSLFFVLLSIVFYFKNKYFYVGLSVATAFLFRFPQGLILLPIFIIIIWDSYNNSFMIWVKESFYKLFFAGLGFAVLVLPYLISNYFLYGNFISPLIYGNNVIKLNSLNSYLYDFGNFYYFKELWSTAPFLYLSIFIPVILFSKKLFDQNDSRVKLKSIIVVAVVFLFYFSWQPHKELRYAITFIPYFAILSGISFYSFLKLFKFKNIFLFVFLIASIILGGYKIIQSINNSNNTKNQIYKYMTTLKGSYATTLPVPVVFGNIKLTEFFDSRASFEDLFKRRNGKIDGIILNSCDIFCEGKSFENQCVKDLDLIYGIMSNSSYKKTHETVINKCTFTIYQK